MKRKTRVLTAAFLTAAFAVTAGFAVQGHVRAARYQAVLSAGYQHAFAELTTAVSELDTALQKGVYAATPGLFSSLCTQAYGKALSAQAAIGELPYGNLELEQTAAFLAKTGDYAMYLSRSAAGDGCTQEERDTLRGPVRRSLAAPPPPCGSQVRSKRRITHAGKRGTGTGAPGRHAGRAGYSRLCVSDRGGRFSRGAFSGL